MSSGPAADDRGRRTYVIVLAILVAGGVAILVAFALPWVIAQVPLVAGVATGTREYEISGHDLFGGAAAAGWICLAGVAGIVATRSWGRTIVGVIVVVAGLAAAITSVVFALRPAGFVVSAVESLTGSRSDVPYSATGWWLVAMLGGAIAAVAGGATILRGRRWPAMGSRYERSPKQGATFSAWDAMDKGVDPTDETAEPRS